MQVKINWEIAKYLSIRVSEELKIPWFNCTFEIFRHKQTQCHRMEAVLGSVLGHTFLQVFI